MLHCNIIYMVCNNLASKKHAEVLRRSAEVLETPVFMRLDFRRTSANGLNDGFARKNIIFYDCEIVEK